MVAVGVNKRRACCKRRVFGVRAQWQPHSAARTRRRRGEPPCCDLQRRGASMWILPPHAGQLALRGPRSP